MFIKFSRHAKRRIKLYKIPEALILTLLKKTTYSFGQQEIIEYVPGYHLPIKVVFDVIGETITVITAYPFKKGSQQ